MTVSEPLITILALHFNQVYVEESEPILDEIMWEWKKLHKEKYTHFYYWKKQGEFEE